MHRRQDAGDQSGADRDVQYGGWANPNVAASNSQTAIGLSQDHRGKCSRSIVRQSYRGGHDTSRPIQPRPLSRQIRQSSGAPSLFMTILSISRSLPENPSVTRPTIFSRWPLIGG
jgi:hypothetical protein